MSFGELAAIRLTEEEEIPLYWQLYEELRKAILEGRLGAGSKLLSAREMAKELGVSRNTVNTAFDQLQAEGYITCQVGAGSFVAEGLPDVLPEQATHNKDQTLEKVTPPLSQWGEALKEKRVATRGRKSGLLFNPSQPALDAFPFDEWARIQGRRWRKPSEVLTLEEHPGGYQPLREAVADYLKAGRSLRCTPEQVIITSGGQQALDLAFRVLLNEGDQIWAEDPGFPGADGALQSVGASLVPVPLDEEGLDVKAGQISAPDAKVALVTPSRNFPLGTAMSLNRRLELLSWAETNNRWIIEDDYDSEFRFDGRPLASLQGMDRHNQVLYVGTFSRVIFPALRLGYLVVPENLIHVVQAARLYMDGHGSILPQVVLSDFFHQGSFARHLRRMKKLYKARGEFLESELRQRFGNRYDITPTDSGMHLVMFLPGLDDIALYRQLSNVGLGARPLSPLYRSSPKRTGLILGFGGFEERKLMKGIDKLELVLSDSTS
ncbi:MAG: PLP-dependent aminotransferase family protein [Rhodospirillales bacterium]|nr:PLP-dependent aminotransferase family protein [Rhodospirillales bacterium]